MIAKCIAFSNLFQTFGWHLRNPSKFAKNQLFISRKFEFKIQVPRIFFLGNISENDKHFDECTIAHATESLRAALQFRATRKLKDRIIRTLKVHLVMLE